MSVEMWAISCGGILLNTKWCQFSPEPDHAGNVEPLLVLGSKEDADMVCVDIKGSEPVRLKVAGEDS